MGIDARDGNGTIFERLPQGFQSGAAEFGKFVEKQYAVVRQRNFAGPGFATAADQRRRGSGVVRIAERAFETNSAVFKFAGNGMNHAGFQCLGGRQRRQY